MALTKSEVESNVSNQQSLVKRVLASSQLKASKVIVPGGKNMLDEIDLKNMQAAVMTWLRYHRHFEWFRFCFVKDPSTMDLETRKVMDFEKNGPYTVWEIPGKGKQWVAERMSDILMGEKLIAIEVKPDGIYVSKERKDSGFGPQSKDWEPWYEVMPVKRGEYVINQ